MILAHLLIPYVIQRVLVICSCPPSASSFYLRYPSALSMAAIVNCWLLPQCTTFVLFPVLWYILCFLLEYPQLPPAIC